MFPIFKNEKLHGKTYIDGGAINNVPLGSLIQREYKDIIVIRIFGIGREKKGENSGRDAAWMLMVPVADIFCWHPACHRIWWTAILCLCFRLWHCCLLCYCVSLEKKTDRDLRMERTDRGRHAGAVARGGTGAAACGL
mgnify:CR=1 FL=1